MTEIGLFFGSTTGNVEAIARTIQGEFGSESVDVASIGDVTSENLKRCDILILGTSTWSCYWLKP